jgi:hypothetical protein
MVTQTALKSTQAPNFARSAMAPLISATVMIAKVSWKAEKTRLGMPVPSSLVAVSTRLCSPRALKPPTNLLTSSLPLSVKVRECP